MRLEGSHTEKNLRKAMQGEALACVKYLIYASLVGKVSKELEEKINHISHNEKEHFKIWAKLLLGDAYYNNEENIASAIIGETNECENMYPEFARVAREEGFEDIAEKFEMVAAIECDHSHEFQEFLIDLIDESNDESFFICLNCGHIHEGFIPDKCPVCDHPQNYFKEVM